MESIHYYNSLASDYQGIFNQRGLYHKVIDAKIQKNRNFSEWKNVLDVGSGQGVRITELFSNSDAQISCVENSSEMAKRLKRNSRISEVFEVDFCQISPETFKESFDVVLLQWNVIGHLADISQAFSLISKVTESGSTLIFDFNNPYNARQYSKRNVFQNLLYFALHPNRNELIFTISHKGNVTGTKFFRPSFVRKLLRQKGFEIVCLNHTDYTTGKRASILTGQSYIEAVRI